MEDLSLHIMCILFCCDHTVASSKMFKMTILLLSLSVLFVLFYYRKINAHHSPIVSQSLLFDWEVCLLVQQLLDILNRCKWRDPVGPQANALMTNCHPWQPWKYKHTFQVLTTNNGNKFFLCIIIIQQTQHYNSAAKKERC